MYLCACLCVSDHPQLFTDQSNCLDRSVIYRYTPSPSLPPSLPSSLLPLNISHDTHLSADKHTEEKLYIHSKMFLHTHTRAFELTLHKPTCKEKTRKAGMGTMAAMKKAVMLLIDVRAMLLPVRRRQFPIRSFKSNIDITQRGEDEPRYPG